MQATSEHDSEDVLGFSRPFYFRKMGIGPLILLALIEGCVAKFGDNTFVTQIVWRSALSMSVCIQYRAKLLNWDTKIINRDGVELGLSSSRSNR